MISSMNQQIVMALDVGGSHAEGALVGPANEVLGQVIRHELDHTASAEVLLGKITVLAGDLQRQANELKCSIAGIGLAMPGPFDYAQGISLMQHKLKALYKVNVKQHLAEETGLSAKLLNDAAAFGLGVYHRDFPDEPRLAAFVVGTGIGGVFLEAGQLAVDGVPDASDIRKIPYRDGSLEEYVSTRGFAAAYRRHGGAELEVKAIAQAARAGEPKAVFALEEFAKDLGAGLALACGSFKPTRIVLGGKINNDLDLYLPHALPAYETQAGYTPEFTHAQEPNPALIGAAYFARS